MLKELLGLATAWFVTAISLLSISQLRWVGIKMIRVRLVWVPAAICGCFNHLGLRLFLSYWAIPFHWVAIGMLATLTNAIVLLFTAVRVRGFTLGFGLRSLLLGSALLGGIHTILAYVLLLRWGWYGL